MDLYVVIMGDILCGTANFVMKQNKIKIVSNGYVLNTMLNLLIFLFNILLEYIGIIIRKRCNEKKNIQNSLLDISLFIFFRHYIINMLMKSFPLNDNDITKEKPCSCCIN